MLLTQSSPASLLLGSVQQRFAKPQGTSGTLMPGSSRPPAPSGTSHSVGLLLLHLAELFLSFFFFLSKLAKFLHFNKLVSATRLAASMDNAARAAAPPGFLFNSLEPVPRHGVSKGKLFRGCLGMCKTRGSFCGLGTPKLDSPLFDVCLPAAKEPAAGRGSAQRPALRSS